MRNILIFSVFGFFFVFASCTNSMSEKSHEKLKDELITVEKEFCSMAKTAGISKAFICFASDSASILRGDKLIRGINAIRKYYESRDRNSIKLEWKPDFVDVSMSGDLGYTFGKYTYAVTDSLGRTTNSEGIFHTVWKRQADGKWRYVWD